MFSIQKTLYGITYNIPVIYIHDARSLESLSNIMIQADYESDRLELFGMEGSVSFQVSEEEVYTAPFLGSDFNNPLTGTLSFLMTGAPLIEGYYQAYLRNIKRDPGICGNGLTGNFQGGGESLLTKDLTTILQIQVLTSQILTSITAIGTNQKQVSSHAVQTIIR